MIFSNGVYDVLAYVGRIVLPALAVFYRALGGIWTGIPFPEEISATIMAIDLLLNTLLGISANQYYKSEANKEVIVDQNTEQG